MGQRASRDPCPESPLLGCLVLCPCYNAPAIYRCQLKAVEARNMGLTDEDFEFLRPYWKKCNGPYDQYIACALCIKNNTLGYFTEHPHGWKEIPGQFVPYENVKILRPAVYRKVSFHD